MQLLIEAARRDIDGGAAVAAVLGNLEARRRLVRTYFLLDTLTYVQRGGRIGRAQAFLGGILQVKPLIAIRDGEVQPQARVRSRRQGIDALTELARSCGDVEAIGVVHSAAPALGEQIRQGLRDVFPGVEPTCVELGPVVGTYAGPGGAGFSCMINGA
jgi:DegV family protein with EDD domain